MVHNGIEYGLMAACTEGLSILRHADVHNSRRIAGAETPPLLHAERYRYDLNLPEIPEMWRRGSVIGARLLNLTAASLQSSAGLKRCASRASDSGEGRWINAAGIDESVPVLSAALYERFGSHDGANFADRVLSAMCQQLGGHLERRKSRHRRG
jgi:6-phosphogluconate dehydrogenase